MVLNNNLNYTLTQYNTLVGNSNNLINNISPGLLKQVLTSNGFSANPSFQTFSSSFTLSININPGSASSGMTYRFINGGTFTLGQTATIASNRLYLPIACTLQFIYYAFMCTSGSNENCTLNLLINNSSTITLNNTIQLNSSFVTGNNSLFQALSAGDYLTYEFVSPTWTTNPSPINFTAMAFFQI